MIFNKESKNGMKTVRQKPLSTSYSDDVSIEFSDPFADVRSSQLVAMPLASQLYFIHGF